MTDVSTSPLLNAPAAARSREPTSNQTYGSEESTPLLSQIDDTPRYDGEAEAENEDCGEETHSQAAGSLRVLKDGRIPESTKSCRRWPTILAISMLGFLAFAILNGAFFMPAIVEEYAKESIVLEPLKLSIERFTSIGVEARVQANFKLDASRVKNDMVREVGRLSTWFAREIESAPSTVEVYLPQYGNLLVGTAKVPKLVVNIRNGHTTQIDLVAELLPGELNSIKPVINDWLEGRLESLKIDGKADLTLKSGLISLGTQAISESLVFEGQALYQTFASFYLGEKSFS